MDLSIIIVNYRSWKRLSECLNSLSSISGSSFTSEVIIVDNNSDDGLIDKFEFDFPDFKFIRNKVNGGYANGCNLGSSIAAGEFLLFLNPDTIAKKVEIEKLLNAAKSNPEYFILSCRQIRSDGRESKATGVFPGPANLTGLQRALIKKFKRSKVDEKAGIEGAILFPDWISGSVVMIRKEIFQKLNGFDEDFWMYFEDVDLCKRARNIGGEVAFFRNITIEHNHGGSSRMNPKITALTKTEVQISRHLYISKHLKGSARILVQIFLVLNNVLSGVIPAIAGIIFFFFPKIFVRTIVFAKLLMYYFGAFVRLSWISPGSVNFGENV
jgi:GT2 family glycosyltransferase